jgi:DNA polymerase-3 subunit delta
MAVMTSCDLELRLNNIMQIKQQALAQYIQKKLMPVYLLIGQDNYLIEDCLNTIKKHIKKTINYDEKMLSVQAVEDWNEVAREANSYSLFSENVLLNILYDKKTIDATGKKVLTEYLKSVNSRCFIIIRAPNVPAKQLQWLANHEHVLLVVAYPLNSETMKHWIINQLTMKSIRFESQVPDLIYHYTQGNLLACAQVIEKIGLSHDSTTLITSLHALEHLSDQCNHTLFELVDACLLGQSGKSIQILRQAANNKTEPTLVLWMLTQEIRILLQLDYLMQQGKDIKTACSELKVWPQRMNFYQASIRRVNSILLQRLLHYCQSIDAQIKSNMNTQVWSSLEQLSLALCSGQAGTTCII